MIRLCLLVLLATSLASGQTAQANIAGRVTDAQGAPIAGAEVVAINSATGQRTATSTNESGSYVLTNLPIGAYSVSLEQPGFRRYVRSGVTLTTGQSLQLDVPLELGAVTESVTITAQASTLETRTSDVTQLIESKTIEDMPLGDRRTMNIIKTTGAAVFINYDSGGKPNFSLAGGRTQSQMFWIDGGSGQNMRLGIGQIDVDPPVETTQEVKVLSNNYSAEYGGSAGGVIIATTKSGGNRYHGSLFEYFRNDKLDAANFFAPTEGDKKIKAPLRYNVFGGTLGGRIVKDKTFFYFAYEGAKRRDGVTRTLTVPTLEQRAGDFSRTFAANGTVVPVYDPSTTRVEGARTLRDAFPANRIPMNRIDPVAAKLLVFYPLPNRPADNITGANNFRANYVRKLDRANYTLKIDHTIGARDKITGRYIRNADDPDTTTVFPNRAADTLNNITARQVFYYAAWTRTLTAALVNDFRFNFGDRFADSRSMGLDGNWASQLGLRGVPDGAFPQFNVAGVTGLGSGTSRRLSSPIRQLQFVDNVSWNRGSHSFKLGAEVRGSKILDRLQSSISGSFTFNPLATGLPGVNNTGIGLASLLVGAPQSFSARETPVLDRRSWYLAGFVQDDWAIRRDLTLNIGLRWETDTPITDANGLMNGFDPLATNPVSGTPGVVRFAGLNGHPRSPYKTDWNNFGPRFGFAWKPGGAERFVVRGGYGIFFAHPFDAGAPNSASLGFDLSTNLTSPDNGITPPFTLRQGVTLNPASAPRDDSFGAVPVGRNPTTSVTYYEGNRRTGYAQQFNFGVQRELGAGMVLEVSYLANLSRKLASANLNQNQIRPELLGPAATQRNRPFPQFNDVTLLFPALGVSAYHAGLARFEKRFSAGLNLLTTYTFSKFLDNTSDGGGALGDSGGSPYSDYYDRRANWGPSDNDIRHRFTFSSVYELPFGKGRRWADSGVVSHLVGNWSLGTVTNAQTGAPFTVNTQVNSTNAFSAGALRADVSRNPNFSGGQRTLGAWFDVGAFSQPAAFRFGNQGVNILRGDGVVNVDLSVLRNFNVREGHKVQFRGELFNALNHADFGLPGHTFGAPGFGLINNANPARRVQLGLRYVF